MSGCCLYSEKRLIEKCEILRIKDRDSNQVQYQGLAHIDDDITGEALIKQLNNCHFQGINLKLASITAVPQRRSGV